MKPITLRMLLIRLATIKSEVESRGINSDEVPIWAEINGQPINLTTENFKVDDSGCLEIDIVDLKNG